MGNPNSVLLKEIPTMRKETDEARQMMLDTIQQFTDMITQIEFPVTAVNPAGGLLLVAVLIEVRDANDVKSLFGENRVGRVEVSIDSGSAADKEISPDNITFQATPLNLSFQKGSTTVWVRASGTGTVVLALADVDSSGLALGGDATVTFS